VAVGQGLRGWGPNAVLACDKPGNHRRGKNILYTDGHVESEGMGGESRSHGMDWD
jgi:prepilin-type processing-associated H-X9-DG protein